ncbi:hypothetical protein D1872_253910 [compost metagenome]
MFTVCGLRLAKIRFKTIIIMYPTTNAMTGDNTRASTIVLNPPQLSLSGPAPIYTAPARAPIRACDEEDGIPNHQVMRFHIIAASNVAISTSSPLSSEAGLAMLPPIVLATPVNVRAPKKFITAASIIAVRGFNALVDTEVAIAFAVS